MEQNLHLLNWDQGSATNRILSNSRKAEAGRMRVSDKADRATSEQVRARDN